jgi:hypothetical protein
MGWPGFNNFGAVMDWGSEGIGVWRGLRECQSATRSASLHTAIVASRSTVPLRANSRGWKCRNVRAPSVEAGKLSNIRKNG